MKDSVATLGAPTTVLLLFLALLAVSPATAFAGSPECPFLGERPPMDEILKRPLGKRPPLCKVNLIGADLTGADLIRANLTGANLTGAILTEAILIETNLTGARLDGAYLASVVFDPNVESVNSVVGIESAYHLDGLRSWGSSIALVILRERFAKAGFRDQERQVTFAKLRSQQLKDLGSGSFRHLVEAVFSYLAFDLTCKYGLDYGRPLRILGALILLFAVVYTIALRGRGDGALWRVWQPNRIEKDRGQSERERLSWAPVKELSRPLRGFLFRLWRALGLGLYFSLLSAFHIGWRELSVGNWITRLHPREYTLRATGWVRVVSGVQSLLSVYLLVLWALTYFGRPFE
jgi:hypothetical protein